MLCNVVNLSNSYIRSTTVLLDISAYRLLSNMLMCVRHIHACLKSWLMWEMHTHECPKSYSMSVCSMVRRPWLQASIGHDHMLPLASRLLDLSIPFNIQKFIRAIEFWYECQNSCIMAIVLNHRVHFHYASELIHLHPLNVLSVHMASILISLKS